MKSSPSDRAPAEKLYYFKPDAIGAHAFHDPVTITIAGGFGALYNRRLDRFDYTDGAVKVGRSVLHPLRTIDDYGWRRFLLNEVIPNPHGQGWNPNWGWHLIGGGFRTRLLKEYFIYHDYPFPTLAAWTTAYSFHFINELLQAQKYESVSVDAVADLLIFDWVGKLIFELDLINQLATEYLHLSEWTYQTQWNPYTNRLFNNGQLYWFRFELLGPISVGGITGEQINIVNLTYSHRQHQISLGVGLGPQAIKLTRGGDARADGTRMNFGTYYSRDDNPLVTFTYQPAKPGNHRYKDPATQEPITSNASYRARVLMNIYPVLISIAGVELGFTVAVYKEAFYLGVSSGHWPIGFVGSTPRPEKYEDDT